MAHTLQILDIQQVTHDVKQFTLQKPEGFSYTPGQATEVSIDKDSWREEKRPFTFTSLPEDQTLEFTIKIYSDHDGVTNKLGTLKAGDCLLVDDAWGTIAYKGNGVFLAGGAGVTPFIPIFRHLRKKEQLKENTLIFSNKTETDIILREEFREMLEDNFINVITDGKTEDYASANIRHIDGFIDKNFLKETIDDFSQHFYVCGPPPFNKSMLKYLKELGAEPEALVFEK